MYIVMDGVCRYINPLFPYKMGGDFTPRADIFLNITLNSIVQAYQIQVFCYGNRNWVLPLCRIMPTGGVQTFLARRFICASRRDSVYWTSNWINIPDVLSSSQALNVFSQSWGRRCW